MRIKNPKSPIKSNRAKRAELRLIEDAIDDGNGVLPDFGFTDFLFDLEF